MEIQDVEIKNGELFMYLGTFSFAVKFQKMSEPQKHQYRWAYLPSIHQQLSFVILNSPSYRVTGILLPPTLQEQNNTLFQPYKSINACIFV